MTEDEIKAQREMCSKIIDALETRAEVERDDVQWSLRAAICDVQSLCPELPNK